MAPILAATNWLFWVFMPVIVIFGILLWIGLMRAWFSILKDAEKDLGQWAADREERKQVERLRRQVEIKRLQQELEGEDES